MDVTRVTSIDIYLVYLGSIRGIDKSDPSIPRVEVVCHSSSEVSTVDLYLLFTGHVSQAHNVLVNVVVFKICTIKIKLALHCDYSQFSI